MRRTLCLAIALLGIVAGCEREVPDAPPVIKFGQDLCSHCNMILSDPKCAAASLVRIDGMREALVFDDIGDLFDYHRAHADVLVERQFVVDYGTKEWVELDDAHLVLAPDLHTPMGSGIIAFASESLAREAAREHGGRVASLVEITTIRAGGAATTQSTDATSSHACCTHKGSK